MFENRKIETQILQKFRNGIWWLAKRRGENTPAAFLIILPRLKITIQNYLSIGINNCNWIIHLKYFLNSTYTWTLCQKSPCLFWQVPFLCIVDFRTILGIVQFKQWKIKFVSLILSVFCSQMTFEKPECANYGKNHSRLGNKKIVNGMYIFCGCYGNVNGKQSHYLSLQWSFVR